MKHFAFVPVALALLAPTWAQDTSAVVVDDGARAEILVAESGAGGSGMAARQLAVYVAEMTARVLDIRSEGSDSVDRLDLATGAFGRVAAPPPEGPLVHIGKTAAVAERFGAEIDALDQDGFIIRGMDGDLVLAGHTPWASEFAVYRFLEDHCGVRWYLPGEIGTVVPRHERLVFDALDDVQEPAFLMRWFSGMQPANIPDRFGQPIWVAWANANLLRPRFAFHHNLYRLLNPEVYGAEHPDWFPLIDGERRPPTKNSSSGWQPCMTSEGAIAQIVANIRAQFDADPQLNSVSIAPNDGGGYCNCPSCLALSENVGVPGEENRSRLFWQFANRIAREVAQTHPDRIIGTLAYSYSKSPYEGMTIEPNIMPFYVSLPAVYRDPEALAERNANIEQWGRIARQMGIYEWYFGAGFSIPEAHTDYLASALRHAYANGARACYSEVYPNWGLDGWKVWIFTKLLWDPQRDTEALLDDFATGMFAEAAEPMRRYMDMCEEVGRRGATVIDPETGKPRWWFFRDPEQFLEWPPEQIEQAQAILDEALAAAKTDDTRRRVRYFSDSLGVTRILSGRYHAAREALPRADSVATIGEALAALASVTGPRWDLDLYMQWRDIKPWQVTEPVERVHGAYTEAKALLAGTLSNEAMRRARDAGTLTPEAVQGLLTSVAREALGGRELSPGEKSLLDEVAFSAGRVAMARRTDAPPTIDGDLSDAVWQSVGGETVPSYTGFFVLQKGSPAQFDTWFRMVHDGRRLYVAAWCGQTKEEFYVSSTGRDGRVWSDDSVELLLNSPDATDPDDFFQVILNCEETPNIYDALHKDATWNADIVAAAQHRPGEGWTLEFSVPLAEIGVDASGTTLLKMNFVRNVIGNREYLEISNWFPTSSSNWDLQSRGWLILE